MSEKEIRYKLKLSFKEVTVTVSSQNTAASTIGSNQVSSTSTFERGSNTEDEEPENNTKHLPTLVVDTTAAHLTSPRSCYEPFEPKAPFKSEIETLQIFRQLIKTAQMPTQSDFTEFNLDDFAIYCDTPDAPCELRCLHYLDTRFGNSNFYFDGILSIANTRVFLRHVPISTVPIGNYGCLKSHTVKDQIWIQSALCKGSDIFYKLVTPAQEYRRFFEPFAWIADLAKHVIDFMLIMAQKNIKVSIHHFRDKFKVWLVAVHGNSPKFATWLAKHPSSDFRASVVANVAFIHKEAYSVLGQKEAYRHEIWAEVLFFTKYPRQPLIKEACSSMPEESPTIVTDYIHQLFSHLPFGDRLRAMKLSSKSQALRDEVILASHLTSSSRLGKVNRPRKSRTLQDIKPGDTISTRRDSEHSGTMWKRELSNGFTDVDRWFGLVQKVNVVDQRTEFEVLWYYRPVDTSCGIMNYPWSNELFLSDHCSCHENHKIQAHQVLDVHQVEFGGNPTIAAEFFCRLVYISQDRKWLRLDRQRLFCSHISQTNEKCENKYREGETHLVDRGEARSEPCELVAVLHGDSTSYRFRRLCRRKDVDPAASTAPPNELVYSNQFIMCSDSQILGRCHVRVFRSDERIPTPYDRDGTGCFFYMTQEEVVGGQDDVILFKAIQTAPSTMLQGLDPSCSIPQLRGLDLFCGGGNFGRGLEEGGAIEMNWANDYDSRAIHTYMANSKDPARVDPFLGSVDDLLRQAMQGRFSKSVPPIGKVDFISGGSPCPGFSLLTNDKTTDKQRKNQSLVASFAAFIDLYRPKYGILENVANIIQRANRSQDVFSQLLCAVVGMGYQAQMILLDASSYGAPQKRIRVFLVFAAPDCKLPDRPLQSHADPPNTAVRTFGRLSTGEAFVERELSVATPFPFVSASQTTSDLPHIHDGRVDTCIAFPDHRMAIGLSRKIRTCISMIPKQPWGMNYLSARPVLSPSQMSCFEGGGKTSSSASSCLLAKNSKAYGRIFPNRVMETIITRSTPQDRKNGRALHWDEDRTITVMEARRAQGFLDEEVLLGTVANKFKIVGNSVARQVALVLGLAVREAWAATQSRSAPHGSDEEKGGRRLDCIFGYEC